jgi:hypothetical protein
VQLIPVTVPMQKPPHQHFGLGILPLNAAHIITPNRLTMHISHTTKIHRLNQDLIQIKG